MRWRRRERREHPRRWENLPASQDQGGVLESVYVPKGDELKRRDSNTYEDRVGDVQGYIARLTDGR